MTKYPIGNGTVIDTDEASASWEERVDLMGTGPEYNHQKLYKTRTGKYYIENFSDRKHQPSRVEWVSAKVAAGWLLKNGHELPEELWSIEEELL